MSPRKSWVVAETFSQAVTTPVKALTKALVPGPRKKTQGPDLRALERAESRRREQQWEDSVNASSEPPGWIDRRRVRDWLSRRGRPWR